MPTLRDYTDKELVQLKWIVEETRDLRYYNAIVEEMNRRTKEE